MRHIRKLINLLGAVALIGLGLALGAEVTDVIGGQWRRDLADVVDTIGTPGWTLWQTALAGTGLALVTIMLIVAELTRPPKGTRIMHPVHSTGEGSTQISGKAAIHAARRKLDTIEGIVDVDATITKTTMTVTVRVDDRSDIGAIEAQVRSGLDHEFWIDLGLADFGVNLLITHHPNPPRVR